MSTPKSTASLSPASTSTPITKLGRKRTKTFTGCWTCRARKIKCDEGRPHCKQCRDKCINCEGYGTRLQWLAPETLNKAVPRSEIPSPPRHSLRRHIPASKTHSVSPAALMNQLQLLILEVEPPKSILTWGQVDGILRVIDSLEPSSASSNGAHVCASIQNFGVFGLQKPEAADHPQGTTPADHVDQVNLDLTTGSLPTGFLEPFNEAFDSPSYSETAAAWDLCNLQSSELQLHSLELPHQQGAGGTDIAIDPALHQHVYYAPDDSALLKASTPEDSCQLIPTHFRSLSPNVVPQQERFLMCHYMNKVVNLFCVIDNRKSPWKTIHLPRVLQGAGELSFGASQAESEML